jgi:hypothetical protein
MFVIAIVKSTNKLYSRSFILIFMVSFQRDCQEIKQNSHILKFGLAPFDALKKTFFL